MTVAAFTARNAFCMSLEKTAHMDNVALLREQLQSLQTRLSTLQGWRMRELTDEQVESIAEEVRDAMRACILSTSPEHGSHFAAQEHFATSHVGENRLQPPWLTVFTVALFARNPLLEFVW
jgi:hypothetical protein